MKSKTEYQQIMKAIARLNQKLDKLEKSVKKPRPISAFIRPLTYRDVPLLPTVAERYKQIEENLKLNQAL